MVTVYTKEELEKALKAKEGKIIVKGKLAEEIKRKKNRKKKGAIAVGTIAVASLLAIPFTGGLSAVAGATAMGLTIGTVVISTTELAILVGGGVAMTALLKGYGRVKINPDGSVEIEK